MERQRIQCENQRERPAIVCLHDEMADGREVKHVDESPDMREQ